jgi:outer membrane lipoprotein-sorting protein
METGNMEPHEVEFEKLVANLRIDDAPDPGHKDRLRWQVLQAYHTAADQPASRSGLSRIRRILMKSSFTKFALAASVIFAVALGLFFGLGSGTIALAQVAEKLEQIASMSYKMRMTMTGLPGLPADYKMNMEMDILISSSGGMRMTAYTEGKLVSTTIMDMREKTMISLMPEMKQYMRITLTDDLLDKTKQNNADPRLMVEQFLKAGYTDLGKSQMDGVEVQGFESTDPAVTGGIFKDSVARIWVDLRTGFPFRMTIEGQALQEGSRIEMFVDNFEWNVPCDLDLFSLVIPDGYTLMGDLHLKGLGNGEELIEALKYFQELSGGRYPKSLNTMDLTQELADLMKAKFQAQANQSIDKIIQDRGIAPENVDPNQLLASIKSSPEQQQRNQEIQNQLMKFTIACTNFQMLTMQKAEPKYYGETVQPGDASKVLARWKTAEGQYRVIYGDLRSEEVTPDRLAELEK